MITAEWDFRDVEKGMNSVKRRAVNLRPVFHEVKELLKLDIADHFRNKEGPFGAWAPRAQSTVERMLSRGGRGRNVSKGNKGKTGRVPRIKAGARRRLGNHLGHLKTATRYTVGRDYIEGRSRAPWSGVHQDGGVAGKGSRIPKREFLWISPTMLESAAKRIQAYVTEAW